MLLLLNRVVKVSESSNIKYYHAGHSCVTCELVWQTVSLRLQHVKTLFVILPEKMCVVSISDLILQFCKEEN